MPLDRLLLGIGAGLFAFGGWHMVTYTAGETTDPVRTLPRALTIGVVVVTLCYIGLNAVYLYVLPLDAVRRSPRIAADVAAGAGRRRRRLGGVGAGRDLGGGRAHRHHAGRAADVPVDGPGRRDAAVGQRRAPGLPHAASGHRAAGDLGLGAGAHRQLPDALRPGHLHGVVLLRADDGRAVRAAPAPVLPAGLPDVGLTRWRRRCSSWRRRRSSLNQLRSQPSEALFGAAVVASGWPVAAGSRGAAARRAAHRIFRNSFTSSTNSAGFSSLG